MSLNVSNSLLNASDKVKAQILINNEFNVFVNQNLPTIKNFDVEIMFNSLRGKGSIFEYERFSPVCKKILQIMIVVNDKINEISNIIDKVENLILLKQTTQTIAESYNQMNDIIENNINY
ncbi:hypothetical protein N9C35_05240, partial [Flavobacteriaceae bacterium]|nr:hypothetical protein [Flavobacteriaceae bacterium]